MMTKPLLAIWLMLVQLLPIASSPLYLCLDRDGSVCIDFGPDHCSCCHDEHDLQSAAEEAAGVALTEHDPCDCAHIRISPATGPVILSSRGDNRPGGFGLVIESPQTSAALLVLTMPDAGSTPAGMPPPFLEPSPEHSSIVLRC